MSSLFRTLFVIAIVAALGYFTYMRLMGAPGAGGMEGGAPPVSVAEVIRRDVQQWSEFSGRLTAVNTAEIRPRVSGVVESVHFDNGAEVNKGELLFIIDPRPFEAAADAAKARATRAEAEFDRARTLKGENAISQRDFDQRKNDAEVAAADYARSKLDLEYTHIRAPFAGKVGRPEITAGNLVEAGPNAPVLTTLVADRPLYIDFEVDEKSFLVYLQSVGADTDRLQSVPVFFGLSGEDGMPHEAHVQSFDNQLNAGSGTIRVRAVFGNKDDALVPGLFARVRLGSAEPVDALLITDRAVGTDQSKKFVWVVGDDNKTERREITLGGMADGLRIVTSGLKPGDKVVVNGVQRIMMPGQPVTPETVPMDAPPPPPPGMPPEGQDAPKEAEDPAPKE